MKTCSTDSLVTIHLKSIQPAVWTWFESFLSVSIGNNFNTSVFFCKIPFAAYNKFEYCEAYLVLTYA